MRQKSRPGRCQSGKGRGDAGNELFNAPKKIKQIDNETEELNKKRKENEDEIKKINKKIKPDEDKISRLTKKIIGLRAPMYTLIILGVILALTIVFLVFIPIAPQILTTAKKIDSLINHFKSKRKEREDQIKPETERRKKLKAELKQIDAQIKTKNIEK